MAVVTATYGRDEGVLGSLGVIGPQNMDYARVVPLVAFTADSVSALFADDGAKGRVAGGDRTRG